MSVIWITLWKPISSQVSIEVFATALLTGDDEMTFEETYHRHAFSELVRLALAAANAIVHFREWHQTKEERHPSASLGPAKPAH